jgi:hypothetical protein
VSFDVIRENKHSKTFHKQIDALKKLRQHSGELGQLAQKLTRQWRDVDQGGRRLAADRDPAAGRRSCAQRASDLQEDRRAPGPDLRGPLAPAVTRGPQPSPPSPEPEGREDVLADNSLDKSAPQVWQLATGILKIHCLPQAKRSRQHERKKECTVCGEKVHLKGMPRHLAEKHKSAKQTSYGIQQPAMLSCEPPCYYTAKRKSQLKEHQKGGRCIRLG